MSLDPTVLSLFFASLDSEGGLEMPLGPAIVHPIQGWSNVEL